MAPQDTITLNGAWLRNRLAELRLAYSEAFPLEQAQVRLEHDRLRLAMADRDGARAALDAARVLFERCGAPRMVDACHRMSLDATRGVP